MNPEDLMLKIIDMIYLYIEENEKQPTKIYLGEKQASSIRTVNIKGVVFLFGLRVYPVTLKDHLDVT